MIPTLGAINAFLAIYKAMPFSIQSFIATSLFLIGGERLLSWVLNR